MRKAVADGRNWFALLFGIAALIGASTVWSATSTNQTVMGALLAIGGVVAMWGIFRRRQRTD